MAARSNGSRSGKPHAMAAVTAVVGDAVAGGARLPGPGEEGGGGGLAGARQRILGGSCKVLGCPMKGTTVRSIVKQQVRVP